MGAKRVSRRGFIEAGAGALGALALGVSEVPARGTAPAADDAVGAKVRLAVVQQDSIPGAVPSARSENPGYVGHRSDLYGRYL